MLSSFLELQSTTPLHLYCRQPACLYFHNNYRLLVFYFEHIIVVITGLLNNWALEELATSEHLSLSSLDKTNEHDSTKW